MSGSLFTPRVYQEPQPSAVTEHDKKDVPDKIGGMVLRFVQYLVIGLLFLIPVFFVPGLPASLGFDKVLLTTIVGFTAVVLLGLTSLRYSKVSTVLPLALGAFWILVAVAFLSGLLSGDIQDALRGSFFETQTAGFLAVMALVMTIPLALQRSKVMALRGLVCFAAGSFVLIAYTLIRLVLAPGSFSLGSFPSVTTSPVGSFNDMAIFAALAVILGLITLLQLPLKKAYQITLSVLVALALIVLAVVNFFHLWIVIGFFGLLLLVYIFSRDALFNAEVSKTKQVVSPLLILVTLMVCVVSIVFVIAGDYVGSRISQVTQIDFIEVRPSITATIDIARDVYSTDLLLGSGPNRFSDAWRIHKDKTINETIFWGTEFTAGFGFVPTLFVTLGILGGLAITAFHGLYLYLGYRMLMRGNSNDTFWYYFGVVTFVAAAFIWGMSYVYVAGPTVLLLGALFTGLSFVAYQALVPKASITIPLVNSRRRGFFLMSIVIILIIASVSALFTIGRQYVAQVQFTDAQTKATTPEEFQQMVGSAYQQYPDDVFVGVLAQARLQLLRNMLTIENPSEAEQEQFVALAVQAVSAAEQAISLDDSNPLGHATLANIFMVLAGAGFEDAENRANGKLADAKWRDPLNPGYAMMSAYLAVQLDDTALARTEISKALELKQNYTEALFLLTQLDIKDGNIDAALATTRQMTTLEPNNPTRYYQLGVLLAADDDLPGAIKAYEAALQRDNGFANARYMLALALLDSNQIQDGLQQLKIVQETNQDNEDLKTLIQQIETNGFTPGQGTGLGGSVNEASPTEQQGDAVVTSGDPNTTLVTPVNGVNDAGVQDQNTQPTPQNPAQ